MHAKYRLKKNFLAQPETNLSSHSALNVAFSPCEREHRRYPLAAFCRCGASPHAREITVLACRRAVMSITHSGIAILGAERPLHERFAGPKVIGIARSPSQAFLMPPINVSFITSKAHPTQANSLWMPASPRIGGHLGLSRSSCRDKDGSGSAGGRVASM